MSNQPLIVAARRRARMLSRNTGGSYQMHLEEIARSAGRADWKAFQLDPAPFPGGHEDTAATTGIHNNTPIIWDEDAPRRGRTRRWVAWLPRWSRRRTAAIVAAIAATGGLATVAVGHQMDLEKASLVAQWDPVSRPSVDWVRHNVPVSRNVAYGDVHAIDLVMIDRRVEMAGIVFRASQALGIEPVYTFSGASGLAMRDAAQVNPIVKWRMHANCRTRRWRLAAIMVARTFDGPPVISEYTKHRWKGGWSALSERNRHAICDAQEDLTPVFEPTPTKRQTALQSMPAGDPSTRATDGDAQWYGHDILHPGYAPIAGPSIASRLMQAVGLEDEPINYGADVGPVAGWTSATQTQSYYGQWGRGPTTTYRLTTHTPEAGAAAVRAITAQIARRFELGTTAVPLEDANGRLVMQVTFSAVPRNDRPMSPVLRSIKLTHDDEGVRLEVQARMRHVRTVEEWQRSQGVTT